MTISLRLNFSVVSGISERFPVTFSSKRVSIVRLKRKILIMKNFFKKVSVSQIVIMGFLAVILAGSFLLCLPIASNDGQWTKYSDALFTSVSSVCVTGLVVVDTATKWSFFGQFVILILIQVGGLGVITVAITIMMFAHRKIGLHERAAVRDSLSLPHIGGVVRFMRFVLATTLVIELIGAVLLSIAFIPDYGFFKGVWYGIFHSVSSFCNAGFDLLGEGAPFTSLTRYSANPLVSITVMLLIISGGIGFLTWDDIRKHKFKLSAYRVQSKIIIAATAALVLLPAIWFFFIDFSDKPLGERILVSLFQAVTPRTAGSNVADLTTMHQSSKLLTMLLMIIGGASGSTAGGMKINTFGILFITTVSLFKRNKDVNAFRRRISDETIRKAAAVMLLYILLFTVSGVAISEIENLPILDSLFETASAIGTVGLSLGVTPTLKLASRIILMTLMFFGRMGGITFAFATVIRKKDPTARLPEDKLNIG